MYAVATLVNPRYRRKLFGPLELATARQWLIDAASLITLPQADRATAASRDVEQPAAKRQRLDDIPSPLDLLDDELLAGGTSREAGMDTAAGKVHAYLQQPNIQRQQCPLTWWKVTQPNYTRVAEVARCYLSAPSTSVASERLFSSDGDIYSDMRTWLAPETCRDAAFHKGEHETILNSSY